MAAAAAKEQRASHRVTNLVDIPQVEDRPAVDPGEGALGIQIRGAEPPRPQEKVPKGVKLVHGRERGQVAASRLAVLSCICPALRRGCQDATKWQGWKDEHGVKWGRGRRVSACDWFTPCAQQHVCSGCR